jgi:hypothetical protein
MVLQDIERYYGMEMIGKKIKVMRITRQLFPVKLMIEQKQLENVESFKYLDSMLTNDGRCTREIKSRIAMEIAAFKKKRFPFTGKMDLELMKKLVKCYILNKALYILYEISKWKVNWVGHILRTNCLLLLVIEGRIEVTGRRGGRRRKLLDDIKERRGYSHLKEEALDRTIW